MPETATPEELQVSAWAKRTRAGAFTARLAFPAALEQEYLRDHTRYFLPVLRLSVSLIIVVYFCFFGFDWLWFDRFAGAVSRPMILGVAAPAAALGILSTWHPNDRFVRTGIVLACVVNGVMLMWGYALGLSNGHTIPFGTLVVYMYYVYFLLGITSFRAFLLATASAALHVGTTIYVGISPEMLYDHTFTMIVVIAVGGLSSRLMEVSSRRNWISERRLRHLAENDALTGLYNQRAFFERADAALSAARVPDREMALIILGLDHLPSYNHQLGHLGADECLRRVGALLATMVQPPHCVGRLGGEQFIILLDGVNETAAEKFVQDLQAKVAAEEIPHPGAPLGLAKVHASLIAGRAPSFASARSAAQAVDERLLRSRGRWHAQLEA